MSAKNYVSEAKSDSLDFINKTKDKLQNWAELLAEGKLAPEDFEWLIFSQEKLAEMNALKEAGLAQIRVEQFKASVLNLVTDTVFHFLGL